MMKTKSKWILTAAVLVLILLLCSGCAGGGAGKWKPYVGGWAIPDKPTMQAEITPNGVNSFLLRVYENNFFGRNGGVIHKDYSLTPEGEILVIRTALGDVPLIHDAKADTLSLWGRTYRRQTPEDAKKLEELKKIK